MRSVSPLPPGNHKSCALKARNRAVQYSPNQVVMKETCDYRTIDENTPRFIVGFELVRITTVRAAETTCGMKSSKVHDIQKLAITRMAELMPKEDELTLIVLRG